MFSSLSRRRVILLVVLTGLLLITLDRDGNPIVDRLRTVVATVLRPIDTAVEAITLPLERAWNGVTSYGDLERENEALRDQIAQMQGANAEAQSAIIEYRELLNLNQLTASFDYPTRTAQVVGESPSNFQNTVEISVGSNSGVQVGMPVTDGAGLIGKISKVFPDRSIVRLITDPNYAITAQVLSVQDSPPVPEQPPTDSAPEGAATTTTSTTTTTTTLPEQVTVVTDPVTGEPVPADSATTTTAAPATTTTLLEVVRETGSLEGQGGGKPLLLRFTDSTSSVTSVKVGAVVDTAGGNNSLAPQGIPIGVITRVYSNSGDSSQLVEVTPNANLRRLNFVTVVLFIPNPDAVGR